MKAQLKLEATAKKPRRDIWTDKDSIKLVELQLAALNAVGESAANRTFNALYVQQELSKYVATNYDATGLSERWTLDQAVKRYTNIRALHKQAIDAMAQTGGRGLGSYKEKYKWWTLMEEIHKNNESVKPSYQRKGNRGRYRLETDNIDDVEAGDFEMGDFEAGDFETGDVEMGDFETGDFGDFESGAMPTSATTPSSGAHSLSMPATPTASRPPKAISLRSVTKRKHAAAEQSAIMEHFDEMETARRQANDYTHLFNVDNAKIDAKLAFLITAAAADVQPIAAEPIAAAAPAFMYADPDLTKLPAPTTPGL
ncbi:hypothetical protein HDU86_007028, partial [Geranomyces michiganensis]